MAGSLFERLTLGAPGAEMDENDSIRENLGRVLGTRRGAVQSLPDYGLPDLNDLSMSRSELQTALCGAIEQLVALYEPRLRAPRVAALPQSQKAPFTMFFSIKADKIGRDGRLEPWNWSISVDGGKYENKA